MFATLYWAAGARLVQGAERALLGRISSPTYLETNELVKTTKIRVRFGHLLTAELEKGFILVLAAHGCTV